MAWGTQTLRRYFWGVVPWAFYYSCVGRMSSSVSPLYGHLCRAPPHVCMAYYALYPHSRLRRGTAREPSTRAQWWRLMTSRPRGKSDRCSAAAGRM
ncbi:hypothetical protein OH77DRAFT_478722 [Trametes cingulata]|nr:hypothetical protein OH77DRAFT_478722 [Trametes cingulata]